jgi:hypothetical protein
LTAAHLVPNASDVVVHDPSGALSEGVTFDWTTFGLKIASTIAEYVPHTRNGWYGTGDQLRASHTWLLIPATATAPTSCAKVVITRIRV